MLVVKVIFWTSLALVFYTYIGYPLILVILSKLLKREVDKRDIYPPVSLLISAHNEEKVIREKVQNSLEIDYPGELEIIVASDCSTDGTDDIVREFVDKGVVLLRLQDRRGKTAVLNMAVCKAKGEIIVFSDANAMYKRDTITQLAKNLNDPHVGCVCGESQYTTDDASRMVEGEKLYWHYEREMKIRESAIGSMVGADGAIYAVRRELYTPLKDSDINDFVNPLQIVLRGYRVVYERDAACVENTASSVKQEFRRKTRIVSRSWRGLFRVWPLLNPFVGKLFTFQLISHKVIRWLMPFSLMALFMSNVFLLPYSDIYLFTLVAQLVFCVLALGGFVVEVFGEYVKVFSLPYYFYMVNVAALVGILKCMFGRVETTWQTHREESGGAGEQGSRGAGERGSRGAGERGSRGAGEQGSRGAGEQGSRGERKEL